MTELEEKRLCIENMQDLLADNADKELEMKTALGVSKGQLEDMQKEMEHADMVAQEREDEVTMIMEKKTKMCQQLCNELEEMKVEVDIAKDEVKEQKDVSADKDRRLRELKETIKALETQVI